MSSEMDATARSERSPAAAPTPAIGGAGFTVGGVLRRTFAVAARNALPFSVVALLLHVPVFAFDSVADESPVAVRIEFVLSGLAGLLLAGALAQGTADSLRGGRVTTRALLGSAFRRSSSIVLASGAVGLWVLGGLVIFFFPGVVYFCALYVAIPAAVLEPERGVIDALQRSRVLTKDHRWAILGVEVLTLLVALAAAFLWVGLLSIVAPEATSPVEGPLTTAILAIAATLGAVAHTVVYWDLRAATEGVPTADLEKVFE